MKQLILLLFVFLLSCTSFDVVYDFEHSYEEKNLVNNLFKIADENTYLVDNKLPEYSDGKTIASARWFEGNDTEKVQSAINSGAYYVLIPYKDGGWKVNPLWINRNDMHLILEEGTLVEAEKGAYRERGDSLLNIENSINITITGYNATIRMHKEDYITSEYEWSEWRMGVVIKSSHKVLIEGLIIEKSGGDGIYIGCFLKEDRSWAEASTDIEIRDVLLNNHYRQGISVISVNGLLVDNVKIYNTHGTAPAAGIDFEPNGKQQLQKNIVIRNCEIKGNQGPGILLYLGHLTSESEPLNISIIDTIVENWPLSIHIAGTENGPRGEITLINSDLKGFRLINLGRLLKMKEEEN